ncbi:MAG: cadmium family heavy metal-translocating P-type ATPase [Oscillospiraceae bacterium]
MVLAVLLAVLPVFLGLGSFSIWLSRALVFLVASCPCAMVISVPLGFYAGIGKASKLGVLIKGGKYLEALAKADTFIFDKTGTLTTGKLSLNSIETKGNLTKNQVLALAASSEINSNHPAAIAIKESAKDLKLPVLTNYSEIAGIGVKAMYNNQEVICGNYRILHSEDCDKYAIYLTIDGILQGKFTVSDTIRKEALSVITKLKSLGITTLAMLTGDNDAIAKDIAQKAGLDGYQAGLLPQDKITAFEKIAKGTNGICMFAGDGINDAPLLARADVGIAMGGVGSDAAIEAADAVLMTDDISRIASAIRIARGTRKIIVQNIALALGVKLIVLTVAAFGAVPMWLAIFADVGVALLAVANAARAVMIKA